MLNCIVNITITQVTPYTDTTGAIVARNNTFTIPYCHSFEVYSTWKNLTDTATVVFPKNMYVIDQNGQPYNFGSNIQTSSKSNSVPSYNFISGFPATASANKAPLFMRGDKITISSGYYYPFIENSNGTFKYKNSIYPIFTGYISSVSSGIPITLKCEDNMWKCKQVAATNKNYIAATDNMGTILADFTAQTGFQVERAPNDNSFSQLNIGNFRILNETWAKVFERLRKDHRLYFYFRENTLRGGGIVYYPQDQYQQGMNGTPIPYIFQKNIIKDELQFKLKTDVLIGAVCYSVNSVKQSKVNAAGQARQSTSRLEVNVPATISSNGTVTSTISKTDATEFFTFFFENVTTKAKLASLGNTQLAKYYYDGFRGKFLTFGLPLVVKNNQLAALAPVIFGNIINISDYILPERNGNYLTKAVKTYFSVTGGFRQEIDLHFRTDNLSQQDLNAGL